VSVGVGAAFINSWGVPLVGHLSVTDWVVLTQRLQLTCHFKWLTR
jgi:hypothetical protein